METEYICGEIGENDDVFEKTRDEGKNGNIIVEERVKNFSIKHHVIDVDYDWHPETYLGKNCLGMDRWKPRECYIHIKYKE